jgi:hypothetical protein
MSRAIRAKAGSSHKGHFHRPGVVSPDGSGQNSGIPESASIAKRAGLKPSRRRRAKLMKSPGLDLQNSSFTATNAKASFVTLVQFLIVP